LRVNGWMNALAARANGALAFVIDHAGIAD
jgi:hypothetical protein